MLRSMTGMANAIQEANVSPVSSPKFVFRTSGTTKFGGDPVITPVPKIFFLIKKMNLRCILSY